LQIAQPAAERHGRIEQVLCLRADVQFERPELFEAYAIAWVGESRLDLLEQSPASGLNPGQNRSGGDKAARLGIFKQHGGVTENLIEGCAKLVPQMGQRLAMKRSVHDGAPTLIILRETFMILRDLHDFKLDARRRSIFSSNRDMSIGLVS
jgi:hypothetical protein